MFTKVKSLRKSSLLNYQCSENSGNKSGNRIGNLSFDNKANLMISIKMKIIDFHKISYILVSIDTVIVGVAGFEPATSCSQSRRDDRATLHPVTQSLFVIAGANIIILLPLQWKVQIFYILVR